MSNPTRREVLGKGLAASAVLVLSPKDLFGASSMPASMQSAARPWLAAALKVDRWLRQSEQAASTGSTWPVDPASPSTVQTDLYSGMAGVVLFYLELHRATGDATALRIARSGADHLARTLPDEGSAPMGLYTGVAGTAVVLERAWRATGDASYRDALHRAVALISRSARSDGSGVEWNESTDIVSGSAGIGLALLALATESPAGVDAHRLAAAAGNRLVERAQVTEQGLTWLIQPEMPRNYPNFSHGTAGVSHYLAALSSVSGRKEHLDAALAGERWLQSRMTSTSGGGRMIHHSFPGNENVFYLSWCHGPAGTARLYEVLARVTGTARFDERITQLARAIVDMKVPERSPGFWNNISQCCGNCGISDFFVSLHRKSPGAGYLAFAEEVAHDTIARATPDGDGLKWIQAEHRVRPELLVAQTGLMQGAAGVGLSMLRLDAAREGRVPFVRLPDDPF